jgi:hypothetical protein
VTAARADRFFPLLTLKGLNRHAASIRLWGANPASLRRTELALLGVCAVAVRCSHALAPLQVTLPAPGEA